MTSSVVNYTNITTKVSTQYNEPITFRLISEDWFPLENEIKELGIKYNVIRNNIFGVCIAVYGLTQIQKEGLEKLGFKLGCGGF